MSRQNWKEMSLLEIIEEIRHLFENYFENRYMAVIIQELPIDFRTLKEIRNLVSIVTIDQDSIMIIQSGINELELFIQNLRNYLLPFIEDRFRISFLHVSPKERRSDSFIIRKFSAFTCPYNICHLENLTGELRSMVNLLQEYAAS